MLPRLSSCALLAPSPSPVERGDLDRVRLFTERAGAARQSFRVTAHNFAAVAEISWRWTVFRLALELGAACLASMSAWRVAERLDDLFQLLTTTMPRRAHFRAAKAKQRVAKVWVVHVAGSPARRRTWDYPRPRRSS